MRTYPPCWVFKAQYSNQNRQKKTETTKLVNWKPTILFIGSLADMAAISLLCIIKVSSGQVVRLQDLQSQGCGFESPANLWFHND